MVRIAHIIGDVVANVSVAEVLSDGEIEAIDCDVGYLYDGKSFSRPIETTEQARAAFKVRRAAAVDAIVVIVDNMKFDGDEESQGRMVRAIVALESAGVESTGWVLADNVPTLVTLAQLRQALVLSGAEQSRLWVDT